MDIKIGDIYKSRIEINQINDSQKFYGIKLENVPPNAQIQHNFFWPNYS